MKAKRMLTISITLVAALLMALLTAGTVLAAAGDTQVEVVGTVNSWDDTADPYTINLEVISSDPIQDPPLTGSLTVIVSENFDFTILAEDDTITVQGTFDEDGNLVSTGLGITERLRDQIKTQECEGEECDPYFCAVDTEKVHPVAEKIATTYAEIYPEVYDEAILYADILGLLCDGDVSLGQIMLALQTAALTGEDFTFYLTGVDEFHWGQIWQEFDIKGKPDKGIPPGEIKSGENAEGNEDQGQKNKDGEEECDGVFCEVYKWLQKGKK